MDFLYFFSNPSYISIDQTMECILIQTLKYKTSKIKKFKKGLGMNYNTEWQA